MAQNPNNNSRLYLLIGLGLVLGVLLLATANVDTLSGMASGKRGHGMTAEKAQKSWGTLKDKMAVSRDFQALLNHSSREYLGRIIKRNPQTARDMSRDGMLFKFTKGALFNEAAHKVFQILDGDTDQEEQIRNKGRKTQGQRIAGGDTDQEEQIRNNKRKNQGQRIAGGDTDREEQIRNKGRKTQEQRKIAKEALWGFSESIVKFILNTVVDPKQSAIQRISQWYCEDPNVCEAQAKKILSFSTLVQQGIKHNDAQTVQEFVWNAQSQIAAVQLVAFTAVIEAEFMRDYFDSCGEKLEQNSFEGWSQHKLNQLEGLPEGQEDWSGGMGVANNYCNGGSQGDGEGGEYTPAVCNQPGEVGGLFGNCGFPKAGGGGMVPGMSGGLGGSGASVKTTTGGPDGPNKGWKHPGSAAADEKGVWANAEGCEQTGTIMGQCYGGPGAWPLPLSCALGSPLKLGGTAPVGSGLPLIVEVIEVVIGAASNVSMAQDFADGNYIDAIVSAAGFVAAATTMALELPALGVAVATASAAGMAADASGMMDDKDGLDLATDAANANDDDEDKDEAGWNAAIDAANANDDDEDKDEASWNAASDAANANDDDDSGDDDAKGYDPEGEGDMSDCKSIVASQMLACFGASSNEPGDGGDQSDGDDYQWGCKEPGDMSTNQNGSYGTTPGGEDGWGGAVCACDPEGLMVGFNAFSDPFATLWDPIIADLEGFAYAQSTFANLGQSADEDKFAQGLNTQDENLAKNQDLQEKDLQKSDSFDGQNLEDPDGDKPGDDSGDGVPPGNMP